MDLHEISDRMEIQDVLMRYYRGIDRSDIEIVRSCFFNDATADYGPGFSGELDAFIEWLNSPALFGGFTCTMHHAGTTIIELDGDTAFTEVYVLAHHTTVDGHDWAGAFEVGYLRYIDRFERREGAWRIADRRVVIEWIRHDTAGMWADVPAVASGSRDRQDPVYRR